MNACFSLSFVLATWHLLGYGFWCLRCLTAQTLSFRLGLRNLASWSGREHEFSGQTHAAPRNTCHAVNALFPMGAMSHREETSIVSGSIPAYQASSKVQRPPSSDSSSWQLNAMGDRVPLYKVAATMVCINKSARDHPRGQL